MMRVAVLIVSYNAKDRIRTCLRSVLSQDYDRNLFDTVVIDNASKDQTAAIVREEFPQVLLSAQQENHGFAGGNTIGMRWAMEQGYDAVVLLNDDTRVRNNWLRALVTTAEQDSAIGIVQSKILFSHEAYRINTIGNPLHPLGFSWSGGYKHLSSSFTEQRDIAVASGASMLITREVIERIGYLDTELFMYHEDVDYSWRARLAGYRIVCTPESVMFHDYAFAMGGRKFYYSERNRLLVIFSLYKPWTIILLVPAIILTEFAMITYAFVSGWGMWKLRSLLGFMWRIPYIIKKRGEVAAIRTISDKKMMQCMTTQLVFEGIKNPLITYVYNPLFWVYMAIVRLLVR